MVKISEIPLILLMAFTLVYATIGNPESNTWSGLYFFVNYLTMFALFSQHKSKKIRIIGISLSVSLLFFIIIKFFFGIEIERFYTLIPFSICLFGLIKTSKK
jgi:uncharacterized membrane protein